MPTDEQIEAAVAYNDELSLSSEEWEDIQEIVETVTRTV